MTPVDNQLRAPGTKTAKQPHCRVCGLPIRQDNSWKDVNFGRDFSISLSIIGENILLAEPKGHITLEDVKQYLNLIADFFQDVFNNDQRSVEFFHGIDC